MGPLLAPVGCASASCAAAATNAPLIPGRIPPAGRRARCIPGRFPQDPSFPLRQIPFSSSSSHEPVSRLLLPTSPSIARLPFFRVRSHFLSLRFSTTSSSFICLSQPDPSCHFPALPVLPSAQRPLALALVSSSLRRQLSSIKDDKDRTRKSSKNKTNRKRTSRIA